MKKILQLFFVLVLALSMTASFAFADDNDTINETSIMDDDLNVTGSSDSDDSDENESYDDSNEDEAVDIDFDDDLAEDDLKAFSSIYGTQMRLLQLELSIDTNIAVGEEIISSINDSAALEAIIVELYSIRNEVDQLVIDLEDETLYSVQEFTAKYVELKDAAIDLSNDFRDIVSESMTQEEREELKDSLDEIKEELRESRKELNGEIKEKLDKHNAQRLENYLETVGLDANDLIEQVATGELTLDELKVEIKDLLAQATLEQRQDAAAKAREYKAKQNVRKAALVDDVKEEVSERIEERREATQKRIETQRESVKDRLEELREATKTRIEERREAIKDRFEQQQEATKERIEEQREATKDRIEAQREAQKERVDERREAQKNRLGYDDDSDENESYDDENESYDDSDDDDDSDDEDDEK